MESVQDLDPQSRGIILDQGLLRIGVPKPKLGLRSIFRALQTRPDLSVVVVNDKANEEMGVMCASLLLKSSGIPGFLSFFLSN